MTQTLPFIAGTCLKPEHYEFAVNSPPSSTWFEVHAENYMGDGGPTHWWLDKVRSDFHLAFHGVGLSIGSEQGLDPDHLERLAKVSARFEPTVVSEHLAWSSHGGVFFNDLLPLPYTESVLTRICSHIDQLQEKLGRQILLENPSTYIQFENNEFSEANFLAEISKRSGCGLLLDVNNVFVSANNQGYDGNRYIDEFPLEQVGEIHLAGHDTEMENGEPLLIDTHDRQVCDAVWSLYEYTLKHTGPLPTLIEWDANIPEWQVLQNQAAIANGLIYTVRPENQNAAIG